MSLTLLQDRYAASVDGVTTYFVRSYISDPGPLKDNGVFLMSFSPSGNITEDSFERVVTVADFDTYTNIRDDAIAAGDSFYRAADVTNQYSNIDTAKAAAVSMQEDVDTLLTEWNTYYDTFFASGEATTLPMTDPTVLAGLVTTYTDAVAATASALAANEQAQAAQAEAAAAVSSAESRYTLAADIKTATTLLEDKVAPMETAITSLESLVSLVGDTPPSGIGGVSSQGSKFMRALNEFIYWFKTQIIAIQNELAQTTPDIPTLQGMVDVLWDTTADTGVYVDFINDSYSPSVLATTTDSIRSSTLPPAIAARDVSVDTTAVDSNLADADVEKSTARAAVYSTTVDAKTKEAEYKTALENEATALENITSVFPEFDPTNPTV